MWLLTSNCFLAPVSAVRFYSLPAISLQNSGEALTLRQNVLRYAARPRNDALPLRRHVFFVDHVQSSGLGKADTRSPEFILTITSCSVPLLAMEWLR